MFVFQMYLQLTVNLHVLTVGCLLPLLSVTQTVNSAEYHLNRFVLQCTVALLLCEREWRGMTHMHSQLLIFISADQFSFSSVGLDLFRFCVDLVNNELYNIHTRFIYSHSLNPCVFPKGTWLECCKIPSPPPPHPPYPHTLLVALWRWRVM